MYNLVSRTVALAAFTIQSHSFCDTSGLLQTNVFQMFLSNFYGVFVPGSHKYPCCQKFYEDFLILIINIVDKSIVIPYGVIAFGPL